MGWDAPDKAVNPLMLKMCTRGTHRGTMSSTFSSTGRFALECDQPLLPPLCPSLAPAPWHLAAGCAGRCWQQGGGQPCALRSTMARPGRRPWVGTRKLGGSTGWTGQHRQGAAPGQAAVVRNRRASAGKQRHIAGTCASPACRWNAFEAEISEQLIRDTADLLVELGLRDAGYR